jgi:hypothetical protein
VILAKGAAVSLPALMNHVDAHVPDWDLVFTNTLLPLRHRLFAAILREWETSQKTGRILLTNLKGIYQAHCTSVFVNKRSIEKYGRLIDGGWSNGRAIDMHMRSLIDRGKLKALTCLPFLTSTSPESYESDIRGQLDLTRRVFYIFSQALFMDADHDQLLKELRQLTKDAKVPVLAEIYLGAVGFVLTDKFEKF